jgi:hypothetical protein
MSMTPILTAPILKGRGCRWKAQHRFSACGDGYFLAAIDDRQGQISICEVTGLSMPECSCGQCIERQLEQFAPSAMVLRRTEALPELADGGDDSELTRGATPPAP